MYVFKREDGQYLVWSERTTHTRVLTQRLTLPKTYNMPVYCNGFRGV